MPILNAVEDVVPGTAKELTRTITGIPTGQTLTRAWLVAKEYYGDTEAEALFLKAIDADDRPGVGQITDNGDTDREGALRFDLDPSDTIKFTAYVPAPYAIWVETSAGQWSLYPYEQGEFHPTPGVISSVTLPEPAP